MLNHTLCFDAVGCTTGRASGLKIYERPGLTWNNRLVKEKPQVLCRNAQCLWIFSFWLYFM